ncbi:MAG: signal recognition particle-docking protein FtsY [Oscillospiraceae bacterium]|jgi:fused signal recognition particle receptor|nr:signal recognition particle-docking protein FtsY [Oscillospiraceae bacterium]
MNIFSKLKEGLRKTKENISSKINLVINQFTKIDEELLEELEETLIMADIGTETSEKICRCLRKEIKNQGLKTPHEVKSALKKIIFQILDSDNTLNVNTIPSIILIVGVNGVGKTTTIGKLAHNFRRENKKVLIAAADTFRAAAIDQLEIWAKRVNCDIIKRQEGSDPASVVFDAIEASKARKSDIIICDTAGRLHNKSNLMSELGKIGRIIGRELPNANKEILLVLDGVTGQNALTQAIEFKKILDITGIIITKLDGSAKGGIVLSIKDNLNIPIKYVGLGEAADDLEPFDAQSFTDALFDDEGV